MRLICRCAMRHKARRARTCPRYPSDSSLSNNSFGEGTTNFLAHSLKVSLSSSSSATKDFTPFRITNVHRAGPSVPPHLIQMRFFFGFLFFEENLLIWLGTVWSGGLPLVEHGFSHWLVYALEPG